YMPFSGFVGLKAARLSLLLNLVDPGIGGVLFLGEKGSGKSALARSVACILPEGERVVDVPLNATEEAVLGGIDLEAAVRSGGRPREAGLLERARNGVLFIDDVNLLGSEVLKLILNGFGVRGDGGSPGGDGANAVEIGTMPVRQRSHSPLEGGQRGMLVFKYLRPWRKHPHAPLKGGIEIVARPGNRTLDATVSGRSEGSSRGPWPLGTASPEEGAISLHLIDRFGLCCRFESLREKSGRVRVLKRALGTGGDPGRFARCDRKLRLKIEAARTLVQKVEVSRETAELIVRCCLESFVEGHRADVVLQRAAVAYAALCGCREVREVHVRRVLPLVLAHRARTAGSPEERERPRERENEPQDGRDDEKGREPTEGNPGEREETESRGDEPPPSAGPPREGESKEEVFAPGDPFRVRRIAFRKDRLERRESGRRTGTKYAGKGGRYVKSILRPRENDIAVDATLRAAAPWQCARGRTGSLIIRREDMRYRQREKKMGHLVVFVVDCSGSMGARKRMVETKAAVLSLLMDCYQKRDRVAMIAFRKDRAEVVLPPTSSVELAARRLREMPVGGKTPLGAGLLAAHNLVRNARFKAPHTRFLVVVVSDGRANHGLSGMPVREEVAGCCTLLQELGHIDFIVVDTEEKSGFMRADLARNLALDLGADYYATNDLKAGYLRDIVMNGMLALS
ncbi:MAG: VWA domain-containing protein, partial [Desulfobacteraceae bacterium]|nr:VWA domain-containing protein [Desulfobacteraceae bacterium]